MITLQDITTQEIYKGESMNKFILSILLCAVVMPAFACVTIGPGDKYTVDDHGHIDLD